LGLADPSQGHSYQANAALVDADGAPQLGVPLAAAAPALTRMRRRAAPQPLSVAAEANAPGETPLMATAEPQTQSPTPPPHQWERCGWCLTWQVCGLRFNG